MEMYKTLLQLGLTEKLAYEICMFCQKHNLTLLEWFYFSNMCNYVYSTDFEEFELNLAFAKSACEHPEYFYKTYYDFD